MALISAKQPHRRHTRLAARERTAAPRSRAPSHPRRPCPEHQPTRAAEWFLAFPGATAGTVRHRARLPHRPGAPGRCHRAQLSQSDLHHTTRPQKPLPPPRSRPPPSRGAGVVFAHVHQCASSARGVRPRVGVALSWGYAQAGQRGGRWQLRSAAVSSASGQPPLQAMQGRISSWAQLCDQPVQAVCPMRTEPSEDACRQPDGRGGG